MTTKRRPRAVKAWAIVYGGAIWPGMIYGSEGAATVDLDATHGRGVIPVLITPLPPRRAARRKKP